MVIRLLSLSTLFPLFVGSAFSQSYFTAMGLRMGSDFGITLQQKILGHLTVEGIVTSSPVTQQTTGTLLVEMHNPIISKRFNFYLGGGLHHRWLENAEGQKLVRRGVTAVAGAEMTLGRINLSWDYKPVFHLNANTQPFESETAVSLRYVFVKKIKKSGNKDHFLKQTPKEKRERKRLKKNREKERAKRKKDRQKSGKTNVLERIFKS